MSKLTLHYAMSSFLTDIGKLLLAVYDLYFAQHAIASSLSFIIENTLS